MGPPELINDDEDLDLSAYDAAVVEHGLYGLVRAQMFDALARGKTWDADLGKGTLGIGARGYHAEMLGTYAKRSRTFLWAWANPGAHGWSRSLAAVTKLRSLGGVRGHAVFDVRSVPDGWINARELSYVSGELAGGHPVYTADAGHAIAFLLALDAGIDPRAVPVAALPRAFFDFQSFAMVDLSACVARFLERVGFEVSSTNAVTRGFREEDGASVRVEWMPDGRIANVQQIEGQSEADCARVA